MENKVQIFDPTNLVELYQHDVEQLLQETTSSTQNESTSNEELPFPMHDIDMNDLNLMIANTDEFKMDLEMKTIINALENEQNGDRWKKLVDAYFEHIKYLAELKK